MFDELIIKNSKITVNTIEQFDLDFWSAINEQHDSNIPAGTVCQYSIMVDGVKCEGVYTANIDDDDYPDETTPDNIEICKINNKLC